MKIEKVSWRLQCLISVTAAVLLLPGSVAVAAEVLVVTCKFDPPDGTVLIEKHERTVTEITKETANTPRVDRDTTITQWTFRKTRSGFGLDRYCKYMEGTLNGKPFANPLRRFIVGRGDTLFLSPDGDLLRVAGQEGLAEEIKPALPTNMWALIDRRFSPQNKLSAEQALWQQHFRRFVGKTVKVGDSWRDEVKMEGEVMPELKTAYSLTEVVRISRIEGRLLVTIITLSSTQLDDIENVNVAHMREADAPAKFFDRAAANLLIVRMSQVRTFDPETMIPTSDERIQVRTEPRKNGWAIIKELQQRTYQVSSTNVSGTSFPALVARAGAGDVEAQFTIGMDYRHGTGGVGSRNPLKSFEWLSAAAAQGHAKAQAAVGTCYAYGHGAGKNTSIAYEWFRKASLQGAPEGDCGIAECYQYGWGVEQNIAEAMQWFRKAAEKGYHEGQLWIGIGHLNGTGVARDFSAATNWLFKAAAQGNPLAYYQIGALYHNGHGVGKDKAIAAQWYRPAAEAHYPLAQQKLGLMYMSGDGASKDEREAFQWIRRAAENGLAEAQYQLSACFALGKGVQKDDAECLYWARKAAAQGFADAQKLVGYAYASGDGIAKDSVEAYKWYALSSVQGNTAADKELKALSTQLSQEQIADAKRRVTEFVPRIEFQPPSQNNP